MEIKIITDTTDIREFEEIAASQFGDMVKAVVDLEKGIMAIAGELQQADEETLLLEAGSTQANLWGINIYPGNSGEDWIEFDSLINIRPSQKNMSRYVENDELRKKIVVLVNRLIRRSV